MSLALRSSELSFKQLGALGRRMAHALLISVTAMSGLRASAQAATQVSAVPSKEQQIAAAVLPLPKELRAGATVLGYVTRDKLEILRAGTNGMICLALFVVRDDFHVACYHEGMEPFMARGRELREQGVKGGQVDSVRFAEVKTGKLKMPKAAALYSLTGKKESWDPATGKVTGASPLGVVYMPGATAATTGLSLVPVASGPWMMYPGTPKAHVMITGSMSP